MKLLTLFTILIAAVLLSCSKTDTSSKEGGSPQAMPNPAYPPLDSSGHSTMPAQPAAAGSPTKHPAGQFGDTTVTQSGLMIIDQKKGTGASPAPTSTISVWYTGKLTDGKVFDSNVGKEPLTMPLTSLIQGWQEGLLTMKVGGKRRLIVPPDIGYGASGSPPTIPPNATLVFDIELLKVQ
jgi:FKBP-type peptidyl-prolyl cis-trans isomerase